MKNPTSIIPLELVQEWVEKAPLYTPYDYDYEYYISNQAFTYGANDELESCVRFIDEYKGANLGSQSELASELYYDRRPDSASLKDEALAMLTVAAKSIAPCTDWDWSVVRRALEALPND